MPTTASRKTLNIRNINPHLLKAQYAVRGELAQGSEIYRQLDVTRDNPQQNGNKLPFDAVISANIGNPQQLDQKPITFFKQVLSILEHPGRERRIVPGRRAGEGQVLAEVGGQCWCLLAEPRSVGD